VTRLRVARIVVPIALAALELSHPTWSNGDVAQAVAATGAWWLPLHVLLIAGYGALVWLLWLPGGFARAMLIAFLVCNTAFLAIDGLAVGLLAQGNPDEADRLWTSPLVTLLANLTGATWAASLLSIAHFYGPKGRAALTALVLTFIAFVASAPPLSVPPLISRLLAAATGAWIIYASGPKNLPLAALAFAAVLHQHVGAEAALGLVLVSLALARLPEPG
jgi:hypothetical protein